jgi:hypothetical protein
LPEGDYDFAATTTRSSGFFTQWEITFIVFFLKRLQLIDRTDFLYQGE